jgi:hypothetical protein
MAIDWDKATAQIEASAQRAGERTDAKLAGEVSSFTRLTDDEVKKLFPDAADAKKLIELMEIVKRGTDQNQKVNQLIANIENLGGVVVKLLGKFA